MILARMPLPPLLADWPRPVQLFLVGLLPASFGFLCGGVLGGSGAAFLALQVYGLGGGGLREHVRLALAQAPDGRPAPAR